MSCFKPVLTLPGPYTFHNRGMSLQIVGDQLINRIFDPLLLLILFTSDLPIPGMPYLAMMVEE